MRHLIVSALALLALATPSFAAVTLTPPVGSETGENGLSADQITDVSRLKPHFCTVTTTGSSNANAGTCNGTAGIVTTNSISMAVTTGSAALTITNNRIQAGDAVLCTVDATGATANSIPICASATVTATQVVLKLANLGAATETANLAVYFLVITKGNAPGS